jgi:hypothetical protein
MLAILPFKKGDGSVVRKFAAAAICELSLSLF